MAQYRKKPVVIEAIQYNNINKDEIEKFMGITLNKFMTKNECTINYLFT